MKTYLKTLTCISIGLTTLVLLGGCASTRDAESVQAKPLAAAPPDLSRFNIVTIAPFDTAPDKQIDRGVGERFAAEIAYRLEYDFGPLFHQVRDRETPLGTNDELLITGTINSFKHGEASARQMGLVGFFVGASQFGADVVLKDGHDNRVLFNAPLDRFAGGKGTWSSRSNPEMMAASAATVANFVARGKGWKSNTDDTTKK